MGWRFRKRIKILPGVYINLSKSGISTNVGIKGASVTFGPKGTYVNTGLPGTGLYRRDKVSDSSAIDQTNKHNTTIENNKSDNKSIDSIDERLRKEKLEQFAVVAKPTEEQHPYANKESTNPKDEIESNTEIIDLSTPINPREPWLKYKFPTIELLKKYDDSYMPTIDKDELQRNMNRVVEVLNSFGVQIHSIHATVGPTITLYEITLAPGVSASKMRGLEDDLALALSSHCVHILIPVPGRGTIGIEVPNTRRSIASMESIINTKRFRETTMDLPCAIGKTITNDVFMFDLAKAPHVLIAGSTGQGKSVTLNAIIMSLLYKKHPNELKFVLMDPYGVEFGMYDQIANHFMASSPDNPVIVTDSNTAVCTLNSLSKLMEARYKLLNKAYARNIKEYNKKFVEHKLNTANGHDFMPYIVVIIDEFGDYIQDRGTDFEIPIVQLAQNARTVGIHLVISTKRPTNDIVTGAIKANFATRIAFKVPERIDSQVILDCDGAENLLGNGDMLYKDENNIDCIRVQGAYVDTFEVERVNSYVREQPGPLEPYELPDPNILNSEEMEDVHSLDPLFEEAARHIVLTQQGSTSMIQRRFSIGYNRAGRLMDQLQEVGIVGEAMGSSPREVLITDVTQLDNLLAALNRGW